MRKVHCTKIGVDCVKNNPENVRLGGPEYIGFVFNVSRRNTEYMKEFIIDTLLGYEVPIYMVKELGEDQVEMNKVSDEGTIARAIREHASEIQEFAENQNRNNHQAQY